MKQISCKAGYKTIQADEGYTFINLDNVLMGAVIHLGKGDKKKNYTEITLAEAEEITRQQETQTEIEEDL
jgi:hypothetical protein